MDETLMLLGHKYEVVEDAALLDGGRVGETQLLRGKVILAPGLTRELRYATKWHEIQHILLSHSGVKEHSELHIDVFTNNIVPVCMYNHHLITELIDLTGYAETPSRKRR